VTGKGGVDEARAGSFYERNLVGVRSFERFEAKGEEKAFFAERISSAGSISRIKFGPKVDSSSSRSEIKRNHLVKCHRRHL